MVFQNQYSYTSPPVTAASNSFTATVTGAVAPGSITVSTDTANTPADAYVIAGPGAIAGAGSLTLSRGTLTISNTSGNTYSGGTTVNGGALLINNVSGSGTGTGPVAVNATGTIGGGGFVGGAATIARGGFLAPSANPTPPPPTTAGLATNLTFQGGLTLGGGSQLNYNLNNAAVPGTGGGNDLATVNGNLALSHNVTLNVTPGSSFGSLGPSGTGTYQLLHYNTLTDSSGGFGGWNTTFQTPPPLASQYVTTGFTDDTAHDNIDLTVSTTPLTGPGSHAPVLGAGGATSFTVAPNTAINNSSASNPIVKVNANGGGGGGGGGGGNAAAQVFLAVGAQANAKAFSFSVNYEPALVAPGTPVFASVGVPVQVPAALGGSGTVSPGAPFGSPALPCVVGCGPVGGGAYYPAGFVPIAPPPDDWLPVFYLSPVVNVVDPVVTPLATATSQSPTAAPKYIGIGYASSVPNSDPASIELVDQVNMGSTVEDVVPTSLNTLPTGADAQFDYFGAFLQLVEGVLPSITDLSQLNASQWMLFDGSYGVDRASNIAWVVGDFNDASLTVVERGVRISEPGTPAVLGAGLMFLGWLRWRRFSACRAHG